VTSMALGITNAIESLVMDTTCSKGRITCKTRDGTSMSGSLSRQPRRPFKKKKEKCLGWPQREGRDEADEVL
jgi:hypothetical protein